MPINSISLIRDTVLWARDVISGAIVDPIADRQRQSGDTGSNARFIMTAFPERPVVHPFITVQDIGMSDRNLGASTEDSNVQIQLQVDVWSKQKGQCDGLAGSVYYALRSNSLDAATTSGLFDFRLLSTRNLDEQGKGGLHRKSMDFALNYIATN